jgi:hypothetical protein
MTTCEGSLLYRELSRANACPDCAMACCPSCAVEVDRGTYCRWCATALQPAIS